MKNLLLIALSLGFINCAETVLYREGKPIARFQSNLKSVKYDDGQTHFEAETMDNATATTAQEQGFSNIISSSGVVVAGVSSIMKK